MQKYNVKPMIDKKNIVVTVPGSKSITNRALMLAAIGNKETTLEGVLFSDDSRAFLKCLSDLGFQIKVDEDENKVTIKGMDGKIPKNKVTIDVRSAGTAARFITVFLAVVGGDFTLIASEQMKKRPMEELLKALTDLGVTFNYLEERGHFPFEMHSTGIKNGAVIIDTTISSQYASALLMAASINGMKIKLTGKRVNGAYIKITLKLLEQFGISYEKENNIYEIKAQSYGINKYTIEPDVSSACYFYAMAVLLRTKTLVKGIHMDSIQGDINFLYALQAMGGIINEKENGVEIDGRKINQFPGLDIDMSDFSDQALTMAVLAAFARTTTTIKNIGHIRTQESDRAKVIVDELAKIGCYATMEENNNILNVIVVPGKKHGGRINTYNDHRVAMSFTLAGLVVPDVVIENPMCCKKTFENYFEIIESLY